MPEFAFQRSGTERRFVVINSLKNHFLAIFLGGGGGIAFRYHLVFRGVNPKKIAVP
ncbi:MAG: hypothetical protein ACTXOO_02455 [Sodalis sp. (in: enterobacteria)]